MGKDILMNNNHFDSCINGIGVFIKIKTYVDNP